MKKPFFLILTSLLTMVLCLLTIGACAKADGYVTYTNYRIADDPYDFFYEYQVKNETQYINWDKKDPLKRFWTERTNYGIKDKEVQITHNESSGLDHSFNLAPGVEGSWLEEAFKLHVDVNLGSELHHGQEDAIITTDYLPKHYTIYVTEHDVTITLYFVTKKTLQGKNPGNEDWIDIECLGEFSSTKVYTYTSKKEVPRPAAHERFELDNEEYTDSDGSKYYICMHLGCDGHVPKVKDCEHKEYTDGICPTTSRCKACGKYNDALQHTADKSESFTGPDGKYYYHCIGFPNGCDEDFPVSISDGHIHQFKINGVSYTGGPISDKDHQPECNICHATYHDINGCTDYYDATCIKPKQCKICSKSKGSSMGHDPDYDHPQVVSDDETRYLCKRSGCNEIAEFHCHIFEDTGKKTPTNECIEISGDSKSHKRKYMIHRQCINGEHCKIPRDFPKWEVESHSWHNEVVKPATCTVDGSKTRMCAICDYVDTTVLKARGYHQYDYSKPQTVNANTVKYLCNGTGCQAYETHNHNYINTGASDVWTSSVRQVSGGSNSQHERKYLRPQKCNGSHCPLTRNADVWVRETHSLTNNGEASSTSSCRQISGNTSLHQRKLLQPKRCACGYTKTEDVWQNESHSWVQKGETHGNCVTPTIKGYQCSKCSMTKTENGAKDPNVHANLATSYVTITNPTCYNDGTGYYPCNACGGRVPTTIKAPGYHTWTVWMITQYPQGNANGTQKRTCRVCGKVESKSFR